MKYDNLVILMPALNPTGRMLELLWDLKNCGFNKISLTDDGSDAESQGFFQDAEALGIQVTHHKKIMGKGAAIRSALKTADELWENAEFYITVDCDGQHSPDDVVHVAQALINNPAYFVIGVRKFEKTDGKKVSYWVNYFQRMFFRITNHGKECPDPRSGLRGFSRSLKELAINTEGDSFNYEMNFLDAAFQVSPTIFVPITAETYTIDETSHFRPVVDLLGMYSKFWRYLLTSNIATVIDLVLFSFFEVLFKDFDAAAIFLATVCARVASGLFGYFLNKYISFRSRLRPGQEMIRYFVVFIAQMAISGLMVTALNFLPVFTVLIKIIVDFVLFFVGYSLQKNWVFASTELRDGIC